VRVAALIAMGQLEAQAAPVVPHLIAALTDSYPLVRQEAATVLGGLGPAARPAVPALLVAIQDHNSQVRCHCRTALGNIGQVIDDDPELTGRIQAAIVAPYTGPETCPFNP
jgi:HEAT repeat protein